MLSKISLYRLVVDTLAFLEHQPMLRGKALEVAGFTVKQQFVSTHTFVDASRR